MKQYIATIAIPGKSKSHVAIIPSSFRLIVHSPIDSDKMCVSINDRTGQLIYITLYPESERSKTIMRKLTPELRRSVEVELRNRILGEITTLFYAGRDWTGEHLSNRALDLDEWREHWEALLTDGVIEAGHEA